MISLAYQLDVYIIIVVHKATLYNHLFYNYCNHNNFVIKNIKYMNKTKTEKKKVHLFITVKGIAVFSY